VLVHVVGLYMGGGLIFGVGGLESEVYGSLLKNYARFPKDE
jgi:hypothetical protein